MKKIYVIFRRTSFILFASFLLYSVIFVFLISVINNTNLQSLLSRFNFTQMEKNGYLIMDDMRREGIVQGPLTDEQRQWLQRRSALYGILLRFESKDRKEAWFDTITRTQGPSLKNTVEVPFTSKGETQGYIKMSYTLSSSQLEPSYLEFLKSIESRSRLLLIIVVTVSVLFSFFIARWLSRPLQEVYLMATEIGKGNREVAVPRKGPEEVRRLATTLHEMTKELKKQEDWRHHLMEDLTHELRTPLTTLLTQIEAIVDGVYEPDLNRMQDIYDELIRLSRLVNDLERLSEAESARFSMHVHRTNIVDLAKHVYANFLPLARNKNIKLLFESVFVPCYAEVDKDKIVQVLSNIVSNAIKYTPAGGLVKIRVYFFEDLVAIGCEDNGIGISQKDLPYIFNRLYRADKSRSRFSGGVGLGLSIAKALTEAHNGQLEVQSDLALGSIFTVTLPTRFMPYMGNHA